MYQSNKHITGIWVNINHSKKNFRATQMDLKIVILSEVKLDREGEVSYEPYMWNLKKEYK